MKRINKNYETEFDMDFEFSDYGDYSQKHPYRLKKITCEAQKKDKKDTKTDKN